MLRTLLIYLSQANWARKMVTQWRFTRAAASRFVAGDTLKEALSATMQLNAKGFWGTLDLLGENVDNREGAIASAEAYSAVLHALENENIKAGISLKLTQLGLGFDYDLCQENLIHILEVASACNNFVRIDMEESALLENTLRIYKRVRAMGNQNVGVVIQSYLKRSEQDVLDLLDIGANIRMVKGAYREPANIAYSRKRDVDANFDLLVRHMIDYAALNSSSPGDGKIPPTTVIATHDEKRIIIARDHARELGLTKSQLEFQFLYGIRPNLQVKMANAGYPVRIYIPYGTQWYPYFVRRLAERPANLWFFLSNLVRR